MTDSIQHRGAATNEPGHEAKCDRCGAISRLGTGACVNCLLHEGLQGNDQMSQLVYATVLDEVQTSHKPWFLGNYEILEQIGCGGMGVIYRARQRHSERIVAIKRVLSYRSDSHTALQRFRREAQAVASLDHPNILPIYEVSESEDGLPFFSMKFAEKGSLHENVADVRNEPRKCVQLMTKVAQAVEYAHSRGVLHRDIKPGNILLNERGEPLVSDFGLAKLLDGNNDLTRSLTTFGTAGFIAPEQAGHAAIDFTPAADVYSLGAVLFNLLAGRPPFVGSNPVSVIRQASETPAPKLRSLAPSLDRDLETICARCLERDPKARYQSAGDLATDLERWLTGRPIIARPVSPPARIWRWSRRNPKLVGAATAGLVLGAAAVWLFRGPLPSNGVADGHLQGLLTNVSHPVTARSTDTNVPEPDLSNPFIVPDYTTKKDGDTRATAAPPKTGFIIAMHDAGQESALLSENIAADLPRASPSAELDPNPRDRSSEGSRAGKKIEADMTAAPSTTESNTVFHNRSSAAGLERKRIAAESTQAPAEPRLNATMPERSSESMRKTKMAGNGPASIQGSVKDAKGEPIKGAGVRIESRDGKQMYSEVKTDSKGRYTSQRLQPGVYRVTLLVNGAVKASITNAQTNANQSTQLNFDFKRTSETSAVAKARKHMVWVPNRTGSHIGGTWVEVDDKGNEHAESNMQTYTTRR
jgi:tRNA A-37 threonylcarbamoyl transferase component Bud32/protocatechuate 3,4-dioxygenase beta subunit